MAQSFMIHEKRGLGTGWPTYVIAEMSANHGGELQRALEIVGAAKAAGADCLKIQTYTADTLTIDCDKEPFQIRKGNWAGETLHQLYRRAYTPWEWQPRIKEEAERLGMDFLSTPFDTTAVDFLEEMGVHFYKIASFEAVDIPLIRYIAGKQKPIILSTGMASLEEIMDAVQAIREAGNDRICLLRCSSSYPAIPEDMNLRIIPFLREYLDLPVGLSDHSQGHIAAVAAAALGGAVIEKHFCLSRQEETADSGFSMEPHEFEQMVEAVRAVERALGRIDFTVSPRERESMVFRRSLFAVRDIEPGECLTSENVRSIRPGYGMKPKEFDRLMGRRAAGAVPRGTPLDWSLIRKDD